jgi:hypothetical protein
MEMKPWVNAAIGCLALALWTTPATAAPISGVTSGPKLASDGNSIVEATHWRRRYGYYYYRRFADDDLDKYYPYEEPYRYYSYPSYYTYYVYPRYDHYHHHHHHHHRHYRDYRRW